MASLSELGLSLSRLERLSVMDNLSRDRNQQNLFHKSSSTFTISPKNAGRLVHAQRKTDDEKHCYLLQMSFQTVYCDTEIPNSCYKRLPRLVNGIPLGAGQMAREQLSTIRWRYVEGSKNMHTFMSTPISQEEAEETKRALKDRMLRQSHELFGDITVKATVILSQCVHFDDEFIINDIAVPNEEGLHFRD